MFLNDVFKNSKGDLFRHIFQNSSIICVEFPFGFRNDSFLVPSTSTCDNLFIFSEFRFVKKIKILKIAEQPQERKSPRKTP